MTAFIRKSIESLLKDREIRRSHNADLRQACEEALEILKDKAVEEGESGVLPTPVASSPIMESVFRPLELACKSKSSGIVTSSLDSIQKLVAYGHLNGASRAFYDKLTESVAKAFSGPQTDADVQLQVIKALLTIVTSANIAVHENSLLLAVKTCFNIFLAGRNVVNQTTAKATLNQMLNNIFFRMEVASKEFKSIPPLPLLEDTESYRVVGPLLSEAVERALDPSQIHKVLQNDCFLLLRSLCKLSIAPISSEETADNKSHGLRSKILSLHLLLSILQNGGETFTSDHIFISVLKQYLCVALSVNGVSIISEVFQLSITLFISILTKYRKYLKSQIEIFFKEICLNILEAASSSFEQKWMVIQGISKICEDPQIVVDIFVNYDCDLNAANIFERLVDDLSKIAQGRQAFDVGASPHQVKKIRIKGLECLVSILKCLVDWSKELYVNPHYTPSVENGIAHGPKEDEHPQTQHNSDHPSQYEKVKQNKDVLEQGIRLFNQKPSKGIPYLISQGIVEDQQGSLAAFLLRKNNRVNKNILGEFLGDLDNTGVMYAYVDLMDFGSMRFVEALRHFLEGFRLPGEAQKIDRLMEKFASRYYVCNPTQDFFASADTAYVLAYSIIMLTTDLHSSQVKKKMTKEEFIRNNRGINDSEDLPQEYLSNIYEEIASSEIKMRANTSEVGKTGFVVDQKKRTQIWSMESENISQTAGALMESAASSSSDVFTSATHLDHVKPMFKLLWSPILAAFSVGLQDCDDAEISQLCLGGIQCAIRISCIFGFSLERNAFVQALARFTLLTDNSNVTEIKAKNIDTIKTLISIAHSDGNYLSSSWLEIMKCISQLEFAQMVGTGSNGSVGGLSAGSLISAASSKALSIAENGTSKGPSEGEASLSEANSQSVIVAVDRIFTGSKNLDGDAIVDFIKALCQVSRDEISSEPKPRMFSLIKLVEISYYNMKRIRLEWSRIWAVLGDHFNDVGCHETQNVSFFAVDSLKQLSFKFLEKGELDNFHFQKDFLRPFEYIVKNNKSTQIRDMVVRCLAQMVQSKARNIKSGWKNIFATFTIAAGDEDSAVVSLSFQSIIHIVESMLEDTKGITVVDFFQDCIKCLSEYACNVLFPEIAMEALQLVRKCASFVAERGGKFLLSSEESEDRDRVWMRGWFPILFELSCVMNRSKLDIRTRSLTILFEVVKNYGGHFQTHWWKDLFKVIFRIFDVGKIDDERSLHQNEWIDTTCNHALCATTDVFNEFFKELSSILLVDLLSLYQWCISQDNDQLSKSAISCLKTLVVTNEKLIDQESEGLILRFLADVVSGTFAAAVTPSKNRVAIHLDVILTVKSVVFNRLKNNSSVISLIDDAYIRIVDSLVASHKSARELISSTEDRTLLPVLIKYETSSLTCCLQIIFEFYVDGSTGLNNKLLDILREAFAHYLSMTSKLQKDEWNSLLLVIFHHLYRVNDEKFTQVMPELYNHTCDILLSSPISNELKVIICKVMKRVGVCFQIVKKR